MEEGDGSISYSRQRRRVTRRRGAEDGGYSRGGVLYTSAIHILQYGRGVAGRLGVAYRRHADVRRSANDWSIVTRRFSSTFSPFPSAVLRLSPSRERDLHECAWSVCRSNRRATPTSDPVTTLRVPNPWNPGRPILSLFFLAAGSFKGGSFYSRLRDGKNGGQRAQARKRSGNVF